MNEEKLCITKIRHNLDLSLDVTMPSSCTPPQTSPRSGLRPPPYSPLTFQPPLLLCFFLQSLSLLFSSELSHTFFHLLPDGCEIAFQGDLFSLCLGRFLLSHFNLGEEWTNMRTNEKNLRFIGRKKRDLLNEDQLPRY